MIPPQRGRQPPKPLDAAALERLALRYVERFATTRARLRQYLSRKLRERGWSGAGEPGLEALAERFAERGYVDDQAFAEAKAGAMGRRGLGAHRIGQALRGAGVGDDDREAVAPLVAGQRLESALLFARRRRIGPFAMAAADPELRRKQVAAMVRGGHDLGLARRIIAMAPGEGVESLSEADEG